MDFSSRNKVKAEWGMASMTDLIFLLLIFFIIMSLMSNNQTPIDLPEAKEDIKPVTDPVEATVIITEDNRYVVMPGGSLEQPMEFEEIKELTASAVDKSGKLKLKIAGHRKASYEAVFNVLALAQANSWDPVLSYEK
ncbi:MAG: biopolymer transporter ExbD [Flavobacteriia bacterium]|jgi:biopolymer transport protein ExbD